MNQITLDLFLAILALEEAKTQLMFALTYAKTRSPLFEKDGNALITIAERNAGME